MEQLQQIYTEALRWYNLPFTVLLGLVLLYWTLQIIGGLLGAAFDFDVDVDVDTDVDLDGSDSFLGKFSRALSDGEAPFMVSLSFFAAMMWGLMMTLNHFFNPASVWALGIAIIAGSLAIALYITRAVMRFVAKLVKKVFGITPQKESFIGAIGIVVTGEVTETFGQIEINHNGVPCRFSVDLLPGSPPLIKGDYARIVSKGREGKTFLVEKTDEEPTLAEGFVK